jgi:hypothetical protein
MPFSWLNVPLVMSLHNHPMSSSGLGLLLLMTSYHVFKLGFSWQALRTLLLVTSACVCYATFFALFVFQTVDFYGNMKIRWKMPSASCFFMFNHEFVALFNYGAFGDLIYGK